MSTDSDIPVVIVAGMGKTTRVIGKNNELLWHIPDDLKRFKELTLGHPVIMGRKTFESILNILGKPLPQRTNIVITRDTSYSHDGAVIVHSFEDALAVAKGEHPTEIHIGGGAEIYKLALPYTNKLYVTLHEYEPEGDVFFPPFAEEFMETDRSDIREHNGQQYQWVDYERKRS